MRKELLSLSIIALMTWSPCTVLAAANYQVQTPTVQPITSQYPLPVNSYQSQDYDYDYDNSYDDNYNYNDDNYYNTGYSNLQGNVVMVPANTIFPAVSMTSLSSETARAGDSVSFYLSSDFYYGNNLIAAAGSRINGTVIIAKKGGLASKNGQLQIKFTNIVTPTGQIIPIMASIQTDDGTGILKAGTAKDVTKEYVKDVGIGAATGAVLGTAMGALSSGSVGKGAIYGTALGGGLGLGKSLIDRGGNIEIPQNSQLNIILDQPVTVSSNTPY